MTVSTRETTVSEIMRIPTTVRKLILTTYNKLKISQSLFFPGIHMT